MTIKHRDTEIQSFFVSNSLYLYNSVLNFQSSIFNFQYIKPPPYVRMAAKSFWEKKII